MAMPIIIQLASQEAGFFFVMAARIAHGAFQGNALTNPLLILIDKIINELYLQVLISQA